MYMNFEAEQLSYDICDVSMRHLVNRTLLLSSPRKDENNIKNLGTKKKELSKYEYRNVNISYTFV